MPHLFSSKKITEKRKNMTERTYPMTLAEKEKLELELEELKLVRRPEVVERIKIARSYGDLSENSEYEAAKDEAVRELNGLKRKAVRELGEINAAIFEAHAMMLEDRDYSDSVKNIIETQSVNAEYAVAATGDNFARMFSGMEDEYFRAKAEDVQDISNGSSVS